jgi:hypothetical protein
MATPIGALCKSGGVRELARMCTRHANAFTHLAWVPTILPSSTLGSTAAACASTSTCFIAGDGHSLRLYQTVIDARTLLYELAVKHKPLQRVSVESCVHI